jgi:uroporphyrin-III C-methyltransferase/precorrin-2 dehydrogenase/sirohydrochlorin ferrochelatase/uroporphyrin-III C-methyltransferase
MKTGKVILAGAGPGDPELITMKAARFLQQADVILTDRLVSKEILNTWANKKAEIIPVGKQCRRGVSTPQQTINELMVHYAGQGKLVVRIKGGDVSIFSNIMDELEVLVAEEIPYEIVPGISAALGAAAYGGIPLTARGYSTAVRFLTCYTQNIITDHNWKELAATDDTLVFYMSSESLDMLVHNLVSNNIAPGKLLAVIEQATTPFQKVHTCDLYHYKETLMGRPFLSPSLVIVGKVVSLQEQFAWIANSNSEEYYFKPLTSTVIPIVENKKNKNVSRA